MAHARFFEIPIYGKCMNDTEKEAQDIATHATIGNRYTCAWLEINSRIYARQTVSLYFVTATITASSVVFGKEHADDNLLKCLSIAICILAWVFVCWIRHHEGLIGLLGVYCREIEKLDDKYSVLKIPAWHNEEQNIILEARKFRRFSDWALIIIIVLSSFPSFYKAWISYYYESSIIWGASLCVSGGLALAAAYAMYRNTLLRKKIACMEFHKDDKDGKYKFMKPQPPSQMRNPV